MDKSKRNRRKEECVIDLDSILSKPPEKPYGMYLRLAALDIQLAGSIPHGSRAASHVVPSLVTPLFGMGQLVPEIIPLSGSRETNNR